MLSIIRKERSKEVGFAARSTSGPNKARQKTTRLRLVATALVAASWITSPAMADELSSSPANAKVYFKNLKDGAVVDRPVQIKFGIEGMAIAPAGTKEANTGHHHLLIDLEDAPSLDEPLPSNRHVKHFGKGQTEVELDLAPGQHTLQLLLGNFAHVPHNPAVTSDKITIIVQ